jgi:hypothetical protein
VVRGQQNTTPARTETGGSSLITRIAAELGERRDPSVFSMKYTEDLEKPKIERPPESPNFPQRLPQD